MARRQGNGWGDRLLGAASFLVTTLSSVYFITSSFFNPGHKAAVQANIDSNPNEHIATNVSTIKNTDNKYEAPSINAPITHEIVAAAAAEAWGDKTSQLQHTLNVQPVFHYNSEQTNSSPSSSAVSAFGDFSKDGEFEVSFSPEEVKALIMLDAQRT